MQLCGGARPTPLLCRLPTPLQPRLPGIIRDGAVHISGIFLDSPQDVPARSLHRLKPHDHPGKKQNQRSPSFSVAKENLMALSSDSPGTIQQVFPFQALRADFLKQGTCQDLHESVY